MRDSSKTRKSVPAHAVHDTAVDAALITRVRTGDPDAFATVFRAYYTPLVRFLTRYLTIGDAAEDVAQEMFIRLWERRAELDPTRSLRAYLFTTARNRAMDVLAHEQVVRHHAEKTAAQYAATFDGPMTPAADEELLAEELAQIVVARVAVLPPRMREIYHLSRDEGQSASEIAETLGIAVQTVYVQLGKIVRALYPVLKPWVDDA